MPTLKGDFQFFHPIRVRYAEVDPQGIVFNAHYLTYFDVAITEYFRSQGFDYSKFVAETAIDFHVVRSEINYKAPAKFDQLIEIGLRGSLKGVRISWQIAIFYQENLLCEGQLIYAVVDLNGRPKKNAADYLQKLNLG